MSGNGVEFERVGLRLADGRALLQDVSLKLEAGTTTALLGRSGSGKTTLLRMVNGLGMPTAGSVTVRGKRTTAWDLIALRRGIGYVIQDAGLFPHMTIERNVGMALELAGTPVGGRAGEVLEQVGLSADLAGRRPWQLSGGQRQRVGFARALAADPEILLMDEPFGALDPLTRVEMQEMLKGLLGRVRKTVLMVTHDLEEALFLADRVVLLEGGVVVTDMAVGEVMGSGNEAVRKYVGAIRRVGAVGGGEPKGERGDAAMRGERGGEMQR